MAKRIRRERRGYAVKRELNVGYATYREGGAFDLVSIRHGS
jgi:hypothetical protein